MAHSEVSGRVDKIHVSHLCARNSATRYRIDLNHKENIAGKEEVGQITSSSRSPSIFSACLAYPLPCTFAKLGMRKCVWYGKKSHKARRTEAEKKACLGSLGALWHHEWMAGRSYLLKNRSEAPLCCKRCLTWAGWLCFVADLPFIESLVRTCYCLNKQKKIQFE